MILANRLCTGSLLIKTIDCWKIQVDQGCSIYSIYCCIFVSRQALCSLEGRTWLTDCLVIPSHPYQCCKPLHWFTDCKQACIAAPESQDKPSQSYFKALRTLQRSWLMFQYDLPRVLVHTRTVLKLWQKMAEVCCIEGVCISIFEACLVWFSSVWFMIFMQSQALRKSALKFSGSKATRNSTGGWFFMVLRTWAPWIRWFRICLHDPQYRDRGSQGGGCQIC